MKKLVLLACTLVVATGLVAAPRKAAKTSTPDPERLFAEATDLSVSLADLSAAAASNDDATLPRNKLLMLDGMIKSVTVRSPDTKNFIAEAELVSGSWKGADAVELYRCFVIFQGERFASIFGPSALPENRIAIATRLIVIGRYVGLAEDYDGQGAVAVIDAFRVIRLE